jgi:hypothetical protein
MPAVRLLSPPGLAAVGADVEPDPRDDRVQRRCLSKQQPGVSVADRPKLYDMLPEPS